MKQETKQVDVQATTRKRIVLTITPKKIKSSSALTEKQWRAAQRIADLMAEATNGN